MVNKLLLALVLLFLPLFLFVPQIYASTYTLTGNVFNDTNLNGILNSGENGIENIEIDIQSLTSDFGTAVFTDANGNYVIHNIPPGAYQVTHGGATGYFDTTEINASLTISSNSVINFGMAAIQNGIPDNYILADIACPNSNGIQCIAIGTQSGNGGNATIITTSDGQNWTSVSNLPSAAQLISISCPKSNGVLCIAVGQLQNHGGLIMTTADGVNWNTLQLPGGINSAVSDITCPNSNGVFCVANEGFELISTTDGGGWSPYFSVPSGINITKITCPNANGIFCIAVGDSTSNNFTSPIFFTTADGINWSQTSSGIPSNFRPQAISCPNSDGVFCIAVGYGSYNPGNKSVIVKSNDGINWTDVSSNLPSTSFLLYDISCPATNKSLCITVGDNFDGINHTTSILTTSDGTNWIRMGNLADLPSYTVETTLPAIVCPNTNGYLCMVISGQFAPKGPGIIPLAAATDLPPAIGSIADTTINQGDTYSPSDSFVDSDSTSWNAEVDYGDGYGFQPLTLTGNNLNLNHIYTAPGAYTVTIYVEDTQGVTGMETAAVTVNAATTYSLSGTVFIDNNNNGIKNSGEQGYHNATVTVSENNQTIASTTTDSNGNYSFPSLVSGAYTETLTLPNGYAATTNDPVTVSLNADTTQNFGIIPNPPSVGAISFTQNPVQINNATTATVSFTDPAGGSNDTAIWDWGDGSTSGTVTESNGSGSVTDNHTYTNPGVYTVKLTVSNPTDGQSTTQIYQYLSAYQATPNGKFAGAKDFNSPLGAYSANTNLTGPVDFAVAYKYTGGQNMFYLNFPAANFTFNSTNISSLVISGTTATLQGTGTITGQSGTYNFTVVGVDNGNIRIQITDPSNNNAVIYDTQPNDPLTAAPTTSITKGKGITVSN